MESIDHLVLLENKIVTLNEFVKAVGQLYLGYKLILKSSPPNLLLAEKCVYSMKEKSKEIKHFFETETPSPVDLSFQCIISEFNTLLKRSIHFKIEKETLE